MLKTFTTKLMIKYEEDVPHREYNIYQRGTYQKKV